MNDTDPRIEKLYRKMLMERSGVERLKMGFSMLQFAGSFILSSLKEKGISQKDIPKNVFLRLYGKDFPKEELEKILNYLDTF